MTEVAFITAKSHVTQVLAGMREIGLLNTAGGNVSDPASMKIVCKFLKSNPIPRHTLKRAEIEVFEYFYTIASIYSQHKAEIL